MSKGWRGKSASIDSQHSTPRILNVLYSQNRGVLLNTQDLKSVSDELVDKLDIHMFRDIQFIDSIWILPYDSLWCL